MGKKKKRNGGTFNTVTSCISTALVLILLGTVVLFVTMAGNFSRSVRENFTVEVLLDDSIADAELDLLRSELLAQPYAKQVTYISKEQGTREMMETLGARPEDFLGGSPIPAEFEVYLRADYANADSLNRYLPALKARPHVKELVYPLDLMDTMNHSIRVVSLVLLGVAVLLAFVSFALINNTVRMSIYARRFSIHTMKLVGARRSFIRRPFMRRAFWIGLVAALVADGVLLGGMLYLIRMNTNDEFEVVTPFVMGTTLGSVLACGLLLTLICTFFSVNRHLRMTTEQIYLK